VYGLSNPKQLSCKKWAAPKNAVVKKDVKSKVAAKKCRLNAKILITTIQVNLCCLLHVSL